MDIKKTIKNSFFYKFIGPLYAYLRMTGLYLYDFFRYFKYSGTVNRSPQTIITTLTHSIERGLALKNPKANFGKEKIAELLDAISSATPHDHTSLCAISTLTEYAQNNRYDHLDAALKRLPSSDESIGGVLSFTKDKYFSFCKKKFRSFSQSRYSLRNFTEEDVSLDLLVDAIHIAQKAPSACNRQSSKVYIIKNQPLIRQILYIQGGSEGFKTLVNKLLIVTSDLTSFLGGYERNQAFIDAGIFGMSLLYALHYLELGACSLAWWPSIRKDKKLRTIASIDNHHSIAFMIAVGHIPKKFKVPKSPRKPLNTIYYVR